MNAKLCAAAAGLLAAAAVASAAFAPGGAAFTKRVDTALLSEPKILATPVAHVSYAKQLKIEDVQGAWLRVSDGRRSGWVFSGNVADAKPSEVRGLDGLPIEASRTTAATAARPLTPVSAHYSERHGLNSAADDLNWLEHAANVTPAELQAFLAAQKKGEYR